MVMDSAMLCKYIGVLIGPGSPPNLKTIRIGTKPLAWWPYRYVTKPDAQNTLGLFSKIVKSGKHLTIQVHFSHTKKVEQAVAQEAIRPIRIAGAQIRSQAPLIQHANDNPA